MSTNQSFTREHETANANPAALDDEAEKLRLERKSIVDTVIVSVYWTNKKVNRRHRQRLLDQFSPKHSPINFLELIK